MALDHFRSLLLQSSLVWKFSPFALNLFLLYNVIRHIAYTCASTVHACKLWINDIKGHAKKNNPNQGVFDFYHGQSWTYYLFFYFSLFIFRLCTISLSSFLTCTSLWLPHLSLFLNLELDIFTLTGALW